MARTMLGDSKISERFWSQDIGIGMHVLNMGLLRENTNKTPYEIWTDKPANVKHFKIFGSKCYIGKDDGNPRKFDYRSNEGIFLGYSYKINAYRFFNLSSNNLVESLNVRIDEALPHEEDEVEHNRNKDTQQA